jgi:hypothetical protein
MSFIVAQTDAHDVSEVGGKAAALSRLATEGFAPPAFFVIRAEAFEAEGSPPDLPDALAGLGPGPFAVRSSARAEDGAEHSHAGQFDTHLNVAPGDVWAAAEQVWRSGFSDRVSTYRAVKTGGAAEGPAVIVQRMIDPAAAGVAFTADPVSGRRGVVVISAIAGLGEALVSGEEDGESWGRCNNRDRPCGATGSHPGSGDGGRRPRPPCRGRLRSAAGHRMGLRWRWPSHPAVTPDHHAAPARAERPIPR